VGKAFADNLDYLFPPNNHDKDSPLSFLENELYEQMKIGQQDELWSKN